MTRSRPVAAFTCATTWSRIVSLGTTKGAAKMATSRTANTTPAAMKSFFMCHPHGERRGRHTAYDKREEAVCRLWALGEDVAEQREEALHEGEYDGRDQDDGHEPDEVTENGRHPVAFDQGQRQQRD